MVGCKALKRGHKQCPAMRCVRYHRCARHHNQRVRALSWLGNCQFVNFPSHLPRHRAEGSMLLLWYVFTQLIFETYGWHLPVEAFPATHLLSAPSLTGRHS